MTTKYHVSFLSTLMFISATPLSVAKRPKETFTRLDSQRVGPAYLLPTIWHPPIPCCLSSLGENTLPCLKDSSPWSFFPHTSYCYYPIGSSPHSLGTPYSLSLLKREFSLIPHLSFRKLKCSCKWAICFSVELIPSPHLQSQAWLWGQT